MAMFPDGIVPERTQQAMRTAVGQKNFPLVNFADEHLLGLPGAPDCIEAVGFTVEVGLTRHSDVPADSRVTADHAHALEVAIDELGFVVFPMDRGRLLYNAGGASNMDDGIGYEILSISGNRITVRGLNPRRVPAVLSSIINPEWPAPDTPAILTTTGHVTMPVGALVEFQAPSALADKLTPRVVQIEAPATAENEIETFDIVVGYPCNAATQPRDLKFPPADGKYSLKLWFYATHPPAYPRFERVNETQWTWRRLLIERAQLDESATHGLTRTSGANGRILPADSCGAVRIVVFRGGGAFETLGDPGSRITGAQTGAGAWTTTVDLTAERDDPTVERVAIEYWTEALAGDERRGWTAGKCANSWHDRTGSYNTHGDEVCIAPEASERATHQAGCWQINCSKFCFGHENNGYRMNLAEFPVPADFRDPAHLGRLWNNTNWILQQGLAGLNVPRNFSVSRPAGGHPSLGEMLGGFAAGVPGGKFAFREEFYGQKLGRQIVVEDAEGHEHQILRYGAFAAQPWLDADAEAQDEQTIGGTVAPGALPSFVTGWNTKEDGDGGSLANGLQHFPYRAAGTVNLYNFTNGDHGLGLMVKRRAGEAFVTSVSAAINPAVDEDAHAQRLRSIGEAL